MSVDGPEQRRVARVSGDAVERRQVVGLFLEVHHHLDGLLQLAGVLAGLGRVAQQVLQDGDVVVDATAWPTQVLGQTQLALAALAHHALVVLLCVQQTYIHPASTARLTPSWA